MPAITCVQRRIRLSHSVSTDSTMACPFFWSPQDDRRPSNLARAVPTQYCIGMAVESNSAATAGEGDAFGRRIIALAHHLAQWSETPDGLTCTYLTPAHRAVAAELRELMQAAGMTAAIDGVGNVVGRYAAADPNAKALIVGSHYDTVLNAGNYDGRLGILAGLA